MRAGPVTLLLAVAFVLASCTGEVARREGTRSDATKLRVASAPYLAFAALHVAKGEGIYERYGLDVELVPLPGTEIAVPLLVDGKIDVLPGQLAPGLLNAIGRGAPVRLVGKMHDAVSAGCSPLHLVTRPGLQGQARGGVLPVRRLSINKQAVMRYVSDRALASRGFVLDSLETVDIPEAAEPEALATGAVDAALTGEPFFSRTVRAGKAEPWIAITDAIPDAEITLLFFGRRVLEEEPDAGVRFLAAHAEALRLLSEGKTERNLTLLAQATREDPEVLRAACWPFGPTDGRVRMPAVMDFQRWALARRLLDSLVSPERLWDGRFLDSARAIALPSSTR